MSVHCKEAEVCVRANTNSSEYCRGVQNIETLVYTAKKKRFACGLIRIAQSIVGVCRTLKHGCALQ
jgi:hypothetical protein